MDKNKIRVGVIGATGGMGAKRLEHFMAHPHCEVTRLAGRSQEKLAALDAPAVRQCTWQELVGADDVDAVCVSTPNTFHEHMVGEALDAGKHVLCEYPLAQTLDGYDALAHKAEAQGVMLDHALTVRHEELHQTRHANLARLGRIVCARITYFGGTKWYVDPALRGDPYVALQVHFIDQFEHHFGRCQWLAANEPTGRDGSPYLGTLLMSFEGDVPAYQEFAMGFPASPPYAGMIAGERGYFEFTASRIAGQDTDGPFEVEIGSGVDEALDKSSQAFVAQLRAKGEPLSPLAEGRRAIELALVASRSAAAGGVRIDV
jgi:predicted dehydrogenase